MFNEKSCLETAIRLFEIFLMSIVGISAIIWVFQAVNYLDIMVEDGQTTQYILNIQLLIPKNY